MQNSILLYAEKYNPIPDNNSVVESENARFTVLTPGLIRMEWAEDGKFEDSPSLTFVNRNLPVPDFKRQVSNGWLEIKTDKLVLKYKVGSGKFDSENLQITFDFDGAEKTWKPGLQNKGNLGGTTRTLDQYNGCEHRETKEKLDLGNGLISREGWVMIDDSETPVFDNSDWPWVMSRPEKDCRDLYFFCYGHDYKTALSDFTKVAGKIALPPKFAFGIWWSRYWEYTDLELRELVDEFELYDLPLDVFVVDMDWHITTKPEWYKDGKKIHDQAGQGTGWTGFTWNKNYFPNPKNFLAWTKEKKMEVCLNLHPASGIQPHEDQYEVMAKAMGIDPETKKYVPFDIVNKKFAENFMEFVLHPMEEDGVDFWWLDWQQWSTTTIPGVNPTFYLNYVFFSDMERRNKKRPLIFHRYGGLGNHRYQIGFSGDTLSTWQSLAFQPYFTATAANVGFGYWSHDIGGHFFGDGNPELYTRWVQFGVFSPIFRTHGCPEKEMERKIWEYPTENFRIMRDAFNLRRRLLPYIYSSAKKAYDTGISICRPMYYDYPKSEAAYEFKNQYMFGDDILAAPIAEPMTDNSLAVEKEVWLPEGEWIEMFTGTLLKGGKVVKRSFALDEIPVFVKAGSIIPMQSEDKSSEALVLNIFPGKSGNFKIYDDEGNNQNFKTGAYSITVIYSEGNKVVINPVEGKFPGMPESRSYELRVPLSFPPERVKVNGKKVDTWSYDGNELTTTVYTPELSVHEKAEVELEFPSHDINLLSGKKKQFISMIKFAKFLAKNNWDKSKYSNDMIVHSAQTGHRITLKPDTAFKDIEEFNKNLPQIIEMIKKASEENPKYIPYLELLTTKDTKKATRNEHK